jgi:hypothetical protein
MLTDDLSDYATSDDETERNLRESEGCEDDGREDLVGADGRKQIYSIRKRKIGNRNKFQRTLSLREQWADFSAKNCAENNL